MKYFIHVMRSPRNKVIKIGLTRSELSLARFDRS